MSIKDQIHKNPSGLKCCHCQFPFERRVTMIGTGQITKGQMWVCSNCANVSIMGDTNLHPMSKEEFDALPKPTQVALASTATGIKRRIDAGGSWSPYAQETKQN